MLLSCTDLCSYEVNHLFTFQNKNKTSIFNFFPLSLPVIPNKIISLQHFYKKINLNCHHPPKKTKSVVNNKKKSTINPSWASPHFLIHWIHSKNMRAKKNQNKPRCMLRWNENKQRHNCPSILYTKSGTPARFGRRQQFICPQPIGV